MDLNAVFGGDTLKAADLQGTEPVVTISKVERKVFDNGAKLIVQFRGKKKALICNKTNAKRIAHLHGQETDDWIGRDVTLYVDMVDFKGDVVEAIRIKAAPRKAPADDQRSAAMDDRAVSSARVAPATAPADMDDEIPF